MAEITPDAESIAGQEALKQHVEAARGRIEREMGDVAATATNAAAKVGLFKELANVARSRVGEARALIWKDFKATAAGALSVIPLVGESGTLAKLGSAAGAGKRSVSAEKAAWSVRKGLEGEKALARLSRGKARREFWQEAKLVPQSPVRLVSDPLKSGKEAWGARKGIQEVGKTADQVARFGEVGALGGDPSVIEANLAEKMIDAHSTYGAAKRRFGKDVLISTGLHVMRKPFPDVPPALVTVARFAEFVLPGANIVPAVWQLGHNKIEWAKLYVGMGLDMGNVVMTRLRNKLNRAKRPEVVAAAAVFAKV